jgi:hypothetical protein
VAISAAIRAKIVVGAASGVAIMPGRPLVRATTPRVRPVLKTVMPSPVGRCSANVPEKIRLA